MWTGCLTHGLNLAMMDFGRLPYVRITLSQANRVTELIRNRDGLSSQLASPQQPRTPLVLINHGETRFCASIVMCERLLELQDNVQELAGSEVWDTASSKATDQKPAFDSARKTMESNSLCDMLTHITHAMEPMIYVLRLADGDEPSMGYAYSSLIALHQSKKESETKLIDNVNKSRRRRKDVLMIIDKHKCILQCTVQSVYGATYARNPRFHTVEFDQDVLNDHKYVLKDCLGEEEGAKALNVLHSYYRNGRRVSDAAEKAAKRLSPHEWWYVYGTHLQHLANIAVKLLGQVPSASACEQN